VGTSGGVGGTSSGWGLPMTNRIRTRPTRAEGARYVGRLGGWVGEWRWVFGVGVWGRTLQTVFRSHRLVLVGAGEGALSPQIRRWGLALERAAGGEVSAICDPLASERGVHHWEHAGGADARRPSPVQPQQPADLMLIPRLLRIAARTPLGHVPVRVRHGMTRGARWTAIPSTQYWRLDFEPELNAAIAREGIRPGSVCWDLGAHFGYFTVGFAMLAGPTGQVAAFEPDPISHRKLRHHVAMNGLESVTLFEAGVSDSTGSRDLLIYGEFGVTTSHFAYDDEDPSRCPTKVAIRTVAGDDLVANGTLRPPQYVKIDVEGHGAKALAGMARVLAEHRPVIFMSFHGASESEPAFALLRESGYRAFDLAGTPRSWSLPSLDTMILRPGSLGERLGP